MVDTRHAAPRASIVIAAHNEGTLLRRTVEACIRTVRDIDYEIVVADDASSDGAPQALADLAPLVRVVGFRRRRGCSATKDLGARRARGDVLVFLDGHCKPEDWAIVRLINDVEDLEGNAIVTPRVVALSADTWENRPGSAGFGYRMRLEDFSCGWLRRKRLRRAGAYFESPALVGCCLAISRKLYKRLRGFDRYMAEWGVEDLDLGLKAWLLGHSILNDPHAVIGHRFRDAFASFSVAPESVLVNEIRAARKNFSEPVWNDWLRRFRARHPRKLFDAAWKVYRRGASSAEREREYLLAHRVRDEFGYARRFRLGWPTRPGGRSPRPSGGLVAGARRRKA